MANRQSNVVNFFQTTLDASVTSGDTTFTVVTTVGGPASPCYIVVDPESAANREIIYCDGVFTGTAFKTTSLSNRDQDANGNLAHNSGTKVWVAPLAQHIDDLNDRIDAALSATTFDAKGDLLAASAADTAARLAVGTDGYVLTADSGETTGLAWTDVSGTLAPAAFEISAASGLHSAVNWSSVVALTTNTWMGVQRFSSGAQNDEAVFLLPAPLRAGTWTLVLLHTQRDTAGIYTVARSADASAWTDLTTIDGYAATEAAARSSVSGLTIPAGTAYLRLKMATKNASSSSYFGLISGIAGIRTGA